MTKLHTGLSGLLALQLLIAAALFWGQQQPGQQSEQQALLRFQTEQLDRVVVSDADHSVTLTKSGDTWVLPDLQRLPADAGKLQELLDKLQSLQSGWPVATTAASQQRFEVADDKFQRRLQLYQGDKLAGELLIGTSPGFRKSHVRRAGDDAVYAVKLNSFDWPAKAEDWLDKALLAAADIKRIEGPDYVLAKQEDGWHFDNEKMSPAPSGETTAPLDQEKARQLATALRNLRIQSVIADPQESATSAGKTTTLQIADAQNTWHYRFNKAGDRYTVSRNDFDNVFSLSEFDYQRIATIDLTGLTVKRANADEDSTNSSQGRHSGENDQPR